MEFSNNDNNERKPPKTPPNKDQLGLDVSNGHYFSSYFQFGF